jgi:multidrug efflux pump subunit AcrA (membrane-fusion protein)
VSKHLREKAWPSFLEATVQVRARVSGYLDKNFEDDSVDPGTGTILMRGVFPNPKQANGRRLLSPGMFARIRLPVGRPKKALLVSDRALGTDQGRKFLYVVKDQTDPETGNSRPVVERRYDQPYLSNYAPPPRTERTHSFPPVK